LMGFLLLLLSGLRAGSTEPRTAAR
jgi:hypothetical protein